MSAPRCRGVIPKDQLCYGPSVPGAYRRRADYLGASSRAAAFAIACGSRVPAASISITFRATISQIGSLRSTSCSDFSVATNARLIRSASAVLAFPKSRLIGIACSPHCAALLQGGTPTGTLPINLGYFQNQFGNLSHEQWETVRPERPMTSTFVYCGSKPALKPDMRIL